MNEYPFPPDEPTNKKSKRFKWAMIFLSIVFCAYQFGFKPLLDEQRSQWDVQGLKTENGEVSRKLLSPGFHIIDFFPFVTVIPDGEVGLLKKTYSGDKTVEKYPVTEIPFGYVGVITDKRTDAVQPKVLKPGRYYLNPELYKVDEVFTGKQTYQFGGGAEDD